MKTKYIGKPYRCRRCERASTERWWWASHYGTPQVIKVAYFCGELCATRYSGFDMFKSKSELTVDILTKSLIGDPHD